MNIGKAMKTIREEQGLPLRAIAERLEITTSGLWKIENNRTRPKEKTVAKFCSLCRVPLARFYTLAFEPADFTV